LPTRALVYSNFQTKYERDSVHCPLSLRHGNPLQGLATWTLTERRPARHPPSVGYYSHLFAMVYASYPFKTDTCGLALPSTCLRCPRRNYTACGSFCPFRRDRMVALVSQNISRLRKISTTCPKSPRETYVSAWDEAREYSPLDPRVTFSKRLFPVLESLTIHHWLPSSHNPFDPKPTDLNRLLKLPPIISPRLHHLELTHIFIPFRGDTLTNLILRRGSNFVLPPVSQFLDMLRDCAHLHKLSLSGWIPSEDPPEPPSVQFTCLRSLSIQYSQRSCDVFLKCVEILSGAFQTFWFWGFELDDYPLDSFAPLNR